MLTDPEPLLPIRGYRAHLHNGTVIDLQAEGMWPTGTQLDWTITTLVIGLPRVVVVQRCRRSDVDLVLRDDGAVWPAVGCDCRKPSRSNNIAKLVAPAVQRAWNIR